MGQQLGKTTEQWRQDFEKQRKVAFQEQVMKRLEDEQAGRDAHRNMIDATRRQDVAALKEASDKNDEELARPYSGYNPLAVMLMMMMYNLELSMRYLNHDGLSKLVARSIYRVGEDTLAPLLGQAKHNIASVLFPDSTDGTISINYFVDMNDDGVVTNDFVSQNLTYFGSEHNQEFDPTTGQVIDHKRAVDQAMIAVTKEWIEGLDGGARYRAVDVLSPDNLVNIIGFRVNDLHHQRDMTRAEFQARREAPGHQFSDYLQNRFPELTMTQAHTAIPERAPGMGGGG